MNEIITINPDEILKNSKAIVFMVVWTNSGGTFFGTGGGGFSNSAHGTMASPAVMRNNAVEEYYNLVKVAKSHNIFKDGRVDLIPLPLLDS